MVDPLNRWAPDGFEFIEYTRPIRRPLGALFESRGSRVARHRSKDVSLFRRAT